jgi:uncharacterized DUF497 family protein
VDYFFEWDFYKERSNRQKHKIDFERAASVFRDPKAMTIFDDSHSEDEERWITLGLDRTGILLVICHTFVEETKDKCRLRIISARKAEKPEFINIEGIMKKEYDFSKGERGKFYRKGVKFHLPIYLDDENFKFIEKIAEKKKSDLNSVVNELISKDLEIAGALTA